MNQDTSGWVFVHFLFLLLCRSFSLHLHRVPADLLRKRSARTIPMQPESANTSDQSTVKTRPEILAGVVIPHRSQSRSRFASTLGRRRAQTFRRRCRGAGDRERDLTESEPLFPSRKTQADRTGPK